MTSAFTYFTDILGQRAESQPEQCAIIYLKDGETVQVELTYAQLVRCARQNAALIQTYCRQGETVLLLLPPGPSYTAAFLGCLYSGAIAVPAYPPMSHKHDLSRLRIVAENAGSKVVLTDRNNLEYLSAWQIDDPHLQVIYVDDAIVELAPDCNRPILQPNDIAFLQYTSGSTDNPKGVEITHRMLMHNLGVIRDMLSLSDQDRWVSWLPPYHDMGLVAGILSPIFNGGVAINFTPQAFLQMPFRWLKALSDHNATITGAPNFAYEYCLKKITQAQKKLLKLDSLRIAANGAEPIRSSTLRQFSEYFAECGFQKTVFYPCYGLAESTVFVTGGEAVGKTVSRVSLNMDKIAPPEDSTDALELIASGYPHLSSSVMIVDPQSRRPLKDLQIGEIWIRSESVAKAYWQNPDLSLAQFAAPFQSGDSNNYLRSGDLGFIDGGLLYVTGRIKEMIIINGRNHIPADLLRSLQADNSELRCDGGAAFTVEINNEERLVIVHEVERSALRELDSKALISKMRRVIASRHGIQPYAVVLIKPLWLPRTSSGKIQHFQAKRLFIENELKQIAQWQESPLTQKENQPVSFDLSGSLCTWLREYAIRRINSRLMDERRCIPPNIVLDFGLQGFFGLQCPPEYGGLGLNYRQSFRLIEQLAAIDSTLAPFVGLQNSLGIYPILHYAQPELRRSLLPLLASGRMLASFALTEEVAGSNPLNIQGVAQSDGNGGWLIDAKKIWIGSAAWAGVFNVFVRIPEYGITGFVVQHDTPGIISGEEALTMGVRGMVQNTVIFRNVRVGPENLLGVPGQGMEIAKKTMQFTRLGIAVASQGTMKRCCQLMYRYAKRRYIGAGSLITTPALLQNLTETLTATWAVEGFVNCAADFLDNGIELPDEIFICAKVLAPELAFNAADKLMQILGGRGYTENNGISQLLRDVRLFRIFEGPTETLYPFLGGSLALKSGDILEFLTNVLQRPEKESELANLVSKVQSLSADTKIPSTTSKRQWEQTALGELGVYLIVEAVILYILDNPEKKLLDANHAIQALKFIETQYELRQLRLMRQSHNNQYLPDVAELEAELAIIDDEIGEIQRLAGDEQIEMDSYIKSDELEISNNQSIISNKYVSDLNLVDDQVYNSIKKRLLGWLARYSNVSPEDIDCNAIVLEYGIDSVTAVEIVYDLEQWLDIPLDVNIIWNYPTLEGLAWQVSEKFRDKRNELMKPLSDTFSQGQPKG